MAAAEAAGPLMIIAGPGTGKTRTLTYRIAAQISERGLPPEVADAQARFYGRIVRVVMKHPAVVTRITSWGTHDGTCWLNFWPAGRRTNHPLLRGRDLKPKPALRGVLDALATP